MSGLKSVNLGRLGEKKFSELCTQQGATCNASTEDDHGWDFILEVNSKHQEQFPADLRDGVLRSLVQVKTTQSTKMVVKLKLSNALKAVQTDLPCFLVIMAYKDDELSGVFIRHFWSEDIERILKRAREAHRDGKEDLNRIYLQFSLKDNYDVQSNIVETICGNISKHGANYAQEKAFVRDNVGYSERRAVGQFTFEEGTSSKDLVDWELSDGGQIALSKFEIEDMRFNIPAPSFPQPSNGSKLSVKLTPKVGTLRIISGEIDLELDAEIFVPQFVDPGHKDYKIRVKTSVFDFILPTAQSGTINVSIRSDQKSVWEYYVTAELAYWDESVPVDFQIDCEAGNLFNGNFHPTIEPNQWSEQFVLGGRTALFLAGRQSLDDLNLDSKSVWSQIRWLSQFYGLLTESPKKLTLPLEGCAQHHIEEVLAYIVFGLGRKFYSVILAFPVLDVTENGNCLDLSFVSAKIQETRCYKTNFEDMLQSGQERFNRLIDGYQRTCAFLGSGNITDWFTNDQDGKVFTIHWPD